jgi:FkbM family methyltransferase
MYDRTFVRLKYSRIQQRYLQENKNHRFMDCRLLGFTMRFDLCNLNDVATLNFVLLGNGYYEKPTSMFILNNLKEGQTFVDIGANIGYYSLLASSIVGESGEVYSFEAMPSTFERMKINFMLNHFRNITAVPIALWHEEMHLPLYVSSESDGLSSLFPYSFKETLTIEATTLDLSLPSKNLDLVKIDVEGSESNVLRGSRAALEEGRIGNIIIEWNPSIYQHIKEWDSRFELFSRIGEIFLIAGSKSSNGYVLDGPVKDRKKLPITSCNLLIRP